MAIRLSDYACPEVEHTGEVTGFTELTIVDNVVTLAKMADMASQQVIGRDTAGTGDPEYLTMAILRNMLNVLEQTDWPTIRPYIDVGESHDIPDRHQMIVNEKMTVDGTLNILGSGELIVLDDDPQVTFPISPDFTYGAGGELTQIDYAGGGQKLFTYGGGGELTVLDYISNGITKRKEYFYGGGGELDYITQTIL